MATPTMTVFPLIVVKKRWKDKEWKKRDVENENWERKNDILEFIKNYEGYLWKTYMIKKKKHFFEVLPREI
jgi:hypothetical protein